LGENEDKGDKEFRTLPYKKIGIANAVPILFIVS
jgi:hypothetical protein